MNKIRVSLKKTVDESYNIVVGRGHIGQLPKHLHALGQFSSCVIITDSVVKKLHGDKLHRLLKHHFPKVLLLSFPAGEKSKTQQTKTFLEEQMLEKGCGRDTLIVALGGGVVGDIAGFIAATYMRGVAFVQIPTTLLAMADSSLGGKTGIDTPQGKNLIGAFCQPKKIFIDFDFVKNLPQKQILNGYYEIVKMTITSNKQLFEFAEKNLDTLLVSSRLSPSAAEGERRVPLVNKALVRDSSSRVQGLGMTQPDEVLEHLIIEGLKIKAKIVEKDEKESDDRMILNFGHTIGHALEQLSGYKLMHGEAVALGVIVESKISQLEGLLHKLEFDRIKALLLKSGLDLTAIKRWAPSQVIAAARKDKKTSGGKLRVVLIEGIGKLHRRDKMAASFISDDVIKKAIGLSVM